MIEPNLINLTSYCDERGYLSVLPQLESAFPLEVKRLYILHQSNPEAERGGHAHPNLWQLILCTSGTVTIEVLTPLKTYRFELKNCDKALIIPPGYWRMLYNFTPETVLVVLANKEYEETIYIRNFETYTKWFNSAATKN